jgi:hypothetical protein
MESKKINQLATELTPSLTDLTIIGDPTTGISKKITLSQMAALFTGTVEEYASFSAFPLVGTADTIYIALNTNVLYRWDTSLSAYVELSPNIISSLVFNDSNGFDGTISLVGSTATLTITTTLTAGSVAFGGASGALSQDNDNFFWDNSNKRLGIATKLPTTALDVFGSGIIGRLNATSTNNAYLGFASNGTNRWSIGNVQSDHRFRIYNEAGSSELVSILPTGEFGIGVANPTTKFHIDGGASALIMNLDADTSIAKSISFRTNNSNRWNVEVSGTESGSNAGMDYFVRSYSDAGALIETPLSIVRSTGVTTIKQLTLTGTLSGTSATFTGNLNVGSEIFRGVDNSYLRIAGGNPAATGGILALYGSTHATKPNVIELTADNTGYIAMSTASVTRLTIANNGAATFTNNITSNGTYFIQNTDYNTGTATGTNFRMFLNASSGNTHTRMQTYTDGGSTYGTLLINPLGGTVGIGVTSINTSFLLDIYQSLTNTTAYARIKNNRNRNAALQLETNLGNFLLGVGIGVDSNRFMIYDNNASATRITIDNNGNFGLGTTPAAWVSTARALQVNGYNSIASQHNGSMNLVQEAYENASNSFAYGTTGGYPSRINMNPNDGAIRIYNAGTGTAGNTITWSERLTILNNGKIGIGADTPGLPLSIHFSDSTSYTTTSRGNGLRVYNTNTNSNVFSGIELNVDGPANGGVAGINAVVTASGSAAMTFYTRDSNNYSEKLRLTSGGIMQSISDTIQWYDKKAKFYSTYTTISGGSSQNFDFSVGSNSQISVLVRAGGRSNNPAGGMYHVYGYMFPNGFLSSYTIHQNQISFSYSWVNSYTIRITVTNSQPSDAVNLNLQFEINSQYQQ